MPNHKPLVRAMDWKIAKKEMPDSISRHLPDGDPSKNHAEIRQEIDRMMDLGPSGRNAMKDYVNGEIDENQFEARLDNISEDMDNEQLERFRQNLRIIKNETRLPAWKEMIPLMYRVDMYKVKKAAEQLRLIQQSKESRNTETDRIAEKSY